ncbi:NAD(P)-dependent oxidoreductase [Eremococcus coleocola]|uniref:NAD(P)-dependent oxidoreductase n=1 Tax=Eremococcus coleocola TaxID=88132 RepID=UPI0009DC140B|nr:NAD(P)-dependent oxidoreductase [Eremococcus coleocola]
MVEADFITLHLPITNETRGLINEQLLKLMKSNSYLIKNSRAAIMDYERLY